MNVEEFMPEEQTVEQPDDLDVQKAVVESLAADKAEQDEKIDILKTRLDELLKENGELKNANVALKAELESNQSKMAEMKTALENVGNVLAKNSESPASSQVALLERDPELADRFAGETRDQVLEVIREARDAAEKDGRVRRAQVLESVLVANEPTGNLDPVRSLELMLLFEKINEMGTTILVVTHEKELVNAFSKRVITIDDGHVVSDDGDGYYSYELE